MIEETLRFKESELEKKESLLRRMTTGVILLNNCNRQMKQRRN